MGWGIFLVIPLIVCAACLRRVPRDTSYVLERLGRTIGVKRQGSIFVMMPLIDRVHALPAKPVETNGEATVISRDNIVLKYPVRISYSVTDPLKARSEISDPESAIRTLVESELRKLSGKMDSGELRSAVSSLARSVQATAQATASRFGLKIDSITLAGADTAGGS